MCDNMWEKYTTFGINDIPEPLKYVITEYHNDDELVRMLDNVDFAEYANLHNTLINKKNDIRNIMWHTNLCLNAPLEDVVPDINYRSVYGEDVLRKQKIEYKWPDKPQDIFIPDSELITNIANAEKDCYKIYHDSTKTGVFSVLNSYYNILFSQNILNSDNIS